MTYDPDAPGQAESGIFGLGSTPESSAVVLIPVPFEATTSYGGGTSLAPARILEASLQVDLTDLETGKPYAQGIAMLDPDPVITELAEPARADALAVIEAYGAPLTPELEAALARVNAASQKVEAQTHAIAKRWIEAGRLVGVVGGDHSVPLGSICAHAEAYGPIGLLHIDAHADLRVAYEGFEQSHASIMERVLATCPGVTQLVQVGLRDLGEAELERIQSDARITAHFNPDLARDRLRGKLLDRFHAIAESLPEQVYVSLDIDGLDPKLCPNTGTPVPGGLDFDEMSALLEAVVQSGRRIIGFDLCEVAPGAEGDWDANVGARVLYKLIGWALKSRDLGLDRALSQGKPRACSLH